MNAERERQVFLEALERPAGPERQAFLEEACRGEPDSRNRIEGLIEAHDKAGDFLCGETPAGVPPRPEALWTEKPGAVVDRYKLLQEIGEGGFGVVYMAEQREPVKRRVALKIIKLGMDTRQVIGRFEAERQALAMMDHPNIAKVLDGGATGTGRPYFVMELVRGVSLLQFCDDNKLSTRQRLELFIPVCHAIHHAHQKGVIHRDIKPSNVLVTLIDDKAMPKVIDFGVAKATQHELTEKTVFTRYQEFIGTPAYMSPEQAQFSGLDVDTRTDIYSLGVLLYELVTGRTPFRPEDLLSAGHEGMRQIIVEQDPPKPSTCLKTLQQEELTAAARFRRAEASRLPRQVEGDLDWIIMKALEKDRSRRYESAAAFAHDIECFLRNEPITAVPPGVTYRARKFARRHRVSLTVGAVIAFFLVLATVVSLTMALRATRAERMARESLSKELKARQTAQRAADTASNALARADEEARIAADVNRYLNEEFLAVADPLNQPNRGITLNELLLRASDRIEQGFQGHPLVEASIRHTLGRVFMNQGNYAEAEEHARRATELRLAHPGASRRDQLASRALLAATHYLQGRYAENEPTLLQLYEAAQSHLGERDPLSLEITYWLCLNYFANSKEDIAEPLTARMMTLSDEVLPSDHWLRAAIIGTRARYFLFANEFRKAEDFLAEWLANNVKNIGAEHPYTLGLMHMLAFAQQWQGKHGKAEALYQETIRLKEKVLGVEHPSRLTTMEAYALFLARRGQADPALAMLQEVFELRKKVLGITHPITRLTVGSMYGVYLKAGRRQTGIAWLQSVLRDDPGNFAALDALGQFLDAATLEPLLPDAETKPVVWKFTESQPDPGWMEPSHPDDQWKSGASPFGNAESVPVRTPWSSRSIWLRREFTLGALPEGRLVLRAMYDDTVQVYLNGRLVMDRFGWTGRDYRLSFCKEQDGSPLQEGRNVLAIRCQNVSREGLFDAGLYVEPPESSLLR